MKSLSGLSLFVILVCFSSQVYAQSDIFFDGGPFYDEVMLNQDFSKDQDPLTETVIVNNPESLNISVRIFLRNGSNNDPFVRKGRVKLNGVKIFAGKDLKIEGESLSPVVTKEVELVSGANTLVVRLTGDEIGTVNLRILRARAFPIGTIFVSSDGDDTDPSCGLKSSPCLTITSGLGRAVATSATQVLVANGIYIENVVLVQGINLLGGYSRDFSRREVDGTGSIIHGNGSSESTVLADSIAASTIFEGFLVQGPSVTTSGSNSVGILARDSTNGLEIRRNIILAGSAGIGMNGFDGINGSNGANGSQGGDSQNSATVISGGTGGFSNGGNGGNSNIPIFDQANGNGNSGGGGIGGAGGSGGDNGKFDENVSGCTLVLGDLPLDGGSGQSGVGGINGNGGLGGIESSGSGATGSWVSANGGNGTNGVAGSGGGGGGAGGGAQFISGTLTLCNVNHDVTGPSGGGGGGRGVGGTDGQRGSGGGGAFGLFLFNGAPTIVDNIIFLGRGGAGGFGGQGGKGGVGGQGGVGGNCLVFGCGSAGVGGQGGSGGHGGGGGGGAGGSSIGIYSNFSASYDQVNTIELSTGVGGEGGAAGQSLGNSGQSGASGSVMAIFEES